MNNNPNNLIDSINKMGDHTIKSSPMLDFLMNSESPKTVVSYEPLDYEPNAWKIFVRDLKIMFGKMKPYKTNITMEYKQRIWN